MDDLEDILEGEYEAGAKTITASRGVESAMGNLLATTLEQQHPFHGMLGRVFDRVGGEDRVVEWADENFGSYMRMMVAVTPSVAPTQGMQGEVHLTINNNLVMTALDE